MNNIRSKSVLLFLIAFAASSCFHRSPPRVQEPQQPTPSPTVAQRSLPARTGSITDTANVFDPAAEKQLELKIEELLRDTDVELAILTVDTTHERTMNDFSLAVARDWKPGGLSGRGLLLVLALKDRQWRLQVSKALEKELPDEVCLKLAEPSVELYKEGKYAQGVDRYIRAIGDQLRKGLVGASLCGRPSLGMRL